jgi:phage major head subunit gpT-like protein
MAINMAEIADTLKPGLAAVWGMGKQYPTQWTEIFEVYQSDKAVEIELEMQYLPLGQVFQEGSPMAVGSMQQAFSTTYVNKYVGLSFAMTRQSLINNLYKAQFPRGAESLRNSLHQAKEILGASVLNNGFNAAYPLGDGQPLFSLAHPILAGGVQANTSTAADLAEGSLEAATIAVQQFKDQAGMLEQVQSTKLIVPPQQQYTANRLLESQFRTGGNLNDISALYNTQMVPQGYKVNQYLSPLMPNAWYLMTNAQDGFKHYVREKVQTEVYTDFYTNNLLSKAFECYCFGVSNFRAAYGNPGV